MIVRRILIALPVIVILFLLQSYFWVPTFDQQTRGNPNRLQDHIASSIGDASILNPILSSDSASSTINGMVFEGLIDRDKDLRYRGRLATSWDIFEEAYFYVNPAAGVPGLQDPTPAGLVAWLEAARERRSDLSPETRESLQNIAGFTVIAPERYSVTRTVPGKDGTPPGEIEYRVAAPARIKLLLKRVDQSLFDNLSVLLGKDYFSSFPSRTYIAPSAPVNMELAEQHARELLPAIEHNPVLLFELRRDVRFHDGHLFDAEDVRFTYSAIMNSKNLSPRLADYEPVKAVEVVTPHTLRIVYKRLYSPAIGTWAMGILPEHLLNEDALEKEARQQGKDPAAFSIRQSRFNRHPVGCGPFRFKEWKSDQYIVLDRFDDYWEGPPNFLRYVYRVIPDPLTQEMEFYAGTIDSYSVQPHQVQRLTADKRFQSFSGISFGYTYIGYNMRREPFDDPRVRRALGMAIDVNKIIDFVLYKQGERITGPFVKQTDFYNRNIAPLPYDPAGALKLLEAAGWQRNSDGWLEKNGRRFQFTLISNSGNDLRRAILAIAQDAWKKIGIDVRTDLLEWSVFIQERVNKLDFDALVLGWSMGIDPDLYQIWHSSQAKPYHLNFVGYRNPEADDLIIKIRQEYDVARQVDYCHRLHSLIARDQPYTFLYVGKWTAVLDKRIVRKEMDAAGNMAFKKITPTKTGDYTFHFNRWIKLNEMPVLAEGDSPEGM